MSEATRPAAPVLARSVPSLPDATRLRLWTGLVLLLFTVTHLLNHALGLVSLDAMERGRIVFAALWTTLPAELLLAASFLLHGGLALHKLWQRRSLRMPLVEIAQLVTGVLIPFWLTIHVLGTAGLRYLGGVRDSYTLELEVIWPQGMGLMTTLLVLVWLHGCIGLHRWLRLRPWYRPLQAPALALALLLPTLALLGVVAAGREYAAAKAADPGWVEALARKQAWPSRETLDRLVYGPDRQITAGLQWLLLGLLAARGARCAARAAPERAPHLSRRARDQRAAGHERAGGEPRTRHPARRRLRRPWPLLHLPGAGGQGDRRPGAALARGAARAGPDQGGARTCGLPASSGPRPTSP